MKNRNQTSVQAFEHAARVAAFVVMLLTGACAFSQERTVPQATDVEAAAGANVKKYINPRQLQTYAGGGGSPTNGATPSQVTNIVKAVSTNLPNLTVTNGATFNGFFKVNGLHGVVKFGPIDNTASSITDAAGVLEQDGTEAFVYTQTPSISGANFQANTISSNSFDAGTRAQLFAGGSGGGGAYTNVTIAGANIVVTYTTNASGVITNKVALADPVTIGTLNVSNAVNVNTGNSNYFGGTNYLAGNVAPFSTADNPTNSYQNASPTFIYTNGAFRTLIVGSYVANVATVGGLVRLTILYTNNGVGYALPVCNITSSNNTAVIPFSFPLSPGGTFQYNTATSGTTLNYPTNVVGWQF